MPGTIASLVCCCLMAFISYFSGAYSQMVIGSLGMLFSLGGWLTSSISQRLIFNQQDPSEIVIDEWAGMTITLMLFPFDLSLESMALYAIGFVLFRFFDIIKPFPIAQLQNLKGGLGIMIDDIAAGLVSLGILCLIKTYVF